MKKLFRDIGIIGCLFVVWRLALFGIERVAPALWPLREGFLGPLPWANLDGVHYLSIAKHGYFQYEQAFFPLYPLLIRGLSFLPIDPVYIALGISHISFFIGLVIFYRLVRFIRPGAQLWSVAFFLAFPTSFFFASAYTESLFFLLTVSCVYAAAYKRYAVASLIGAIASSVRLFGVFLVPFVVSVWALCVPVGLFLYMGYLYQMVGDPLFFFHAQPAFGAERSGTALIFLPQVLWRYFKIIVTASPGTVTYGVSIFELVVLIGALIVLWIGVKKNIVKSSYTLYSLLIIIVPTLTGTLSSLPRYVLSAFPLFIILGSMHNTRQKLLMLVLFGVGLVVFCSLFLQGYFIS